MVTLVSGRRAGGVGGGRFRSYCIRRAMCCTPPGAAGGWATVMVLPLSGRVVSSDGSRISELPFVCGDKKPIKRTPAAHFVDLIAKGYPGVPIFLRPHADYLARLYTDPGPPVPLVGRLLADLRVSSLVCVNNASERVLFGSASEEEKSAAAPTATTDDAVSPEDPVDGAEHSPPLKKPNKKTARWLAEMANDHRFIMVRIGRPADWDSKKESKRLQKFATTLYMQAPSSSLIVLLCTRSHEKPTDSNGHRRPLNPIISQAFLALTNPSRFAERVSNSAS
ncbi:unnamed protein product [Schistocephalus solidus]|uniref:Uncharacterized protein n=1 Tax=Schistocephalus solidus TaxID=70667 RepID=A0A183TMC8_SCHSO|nr:unnamed protein product [Schistocephalus solidus]